MTEVRNQVQNVKAQDAGGEINNHLYEFEVSMQIV